jgi:hypothetical protein
MAEFAKGSRVKIKGTEFTGTIAGIYPNGPTIDFVPDADGVKTWPTISAIPVDWLEYAEPYSWPPQAGDIWEADGGEWAAMKNAAGGVTMVELLHYSKSARVVREFMDLNPVLVRRREVKP